MADVINNKLESVCQELPELDFMDLPVCRPTRRRPPEVEPCDVHTTLNSLKVRKSSGPTALPFRIIKEVFCRIAAPLTDVLNTSLTQ